MMALGTHFTYEAILLLAIVYGIRSNRLIPLPNPVESPHMKNQSFYICGGGESGIIVNTFSITVLSLLPGHHHSL